MVFNDVPGVEVEFPPGCLDEELEAYIRVLFDTEPVEMQAERFSHGLKALASPVIMLGPHGHQFRSSQPPVSCKFSFQSKDIYWLDVELKEKNSILDRDLNTGVHIFSNHIVCNRLFSRNSWSSSSIHFFMIINSSRS